MSNFENKLVEVCSECQQASCWYGEFMCFEARDAGTELKTVSELRELSLEHEDNWSDKKMNEICGDPAPNGYKTGTMEEYTGPRRCDLCQFEKDAPCQTRDCNSVNGLAEFVSKDAKPETGKTDFSSRLIMEDWEISWGNEDHISIVGPNNQTCMVVPGDFESLLSGLCGVYHSY